MVEFTRRLEEPVKAVQVLCSPTKPGEFQYIGRFRKEGAYGLIYCCPCGCGGEGLLQFDNDQGSDNVHPKWHWDGNKEAPTLTPGIRRIGGCGWHGFLTAGVFKDA